MQNLFFISCGESWRNLIESRKIDVHEMPNYREKTETSCRNGSLMRHFGTCSCNEIRATSVPFAKNCRARISSSWRKAPETCAILDYMKLEQPLFPFTLFQSVNKCSTKIISHLKTPVRSRYYLLSNADTFQAILESKIINSPNAKKYILFRIAPHNCEQLRNFGIVIMKYVPRNALVARLQNKEQNSRFNKTRGRATKIRSNLGKFKYIPPRSERKQNSWKFLNHPDVEFSAITSVHCKSRCSFHFPKKKDCIGLFSQELHQ